PHTYAIRLHTERANRETPPPPTAGQLVLLRRSLGEDFWVKRWPCSWSRLLAVLIPRSSTGTRALLKATDQARLPVGQTQTFDAQNFSSRCAQPARPIGFR